MIQILPLANVLHEEIVLEDDFNSHHEGWEIIKDEEEQAFIKDSYYWMENTSISRWMFYHKKMPLNLDENFIIKASIELLHNKQGYGQFGLVWGFDKKHSQLNKFVVSSNTSRFTISDFEKDHAFANHRFSGKYEKDPFSKNEQFFSIVKLEDYYYFFLNGHSKPVYVTHVSQMGQSGDRFGFYVEPGLMIRCNKISVKRLIVDPNFEHNPWMPLTDDEMPFGSVILRG
jgi:hypothetical protein